MSLATWATAARGLSRSGPREATVSLGGHGGARSPLGRARLAPSASHPLPRTLCLAPSASHPLPRTLCLAPSASQPLPRTLCLAPSASHPLPRTLCLAGEGEGRGRTVACGVRRVGAGTRAHVGSHEHRAVGGELLADDVRDEHDACDARRTAWEGRRGGRGRGRGSV